MIVSLIRYRYTEQRTVLSSVQGSLPYEILNISSYVNQPFECNGPIDVNLITQIYVKDQAVCISPISALLMLFLNCHADSKMKFIHPFHEKVITGRYSCCLLLMGKCNSR